MLILIILIITILLVAAGFRIVPQGSAYVVERLGKYRTTWQSGPHVLIPGIDAVRRKVLIKEQVADFAPYLGVNFEKDYNKAIFTLNTCILGN